ncbi:MAG: MEDS domain-containing protein [Nitrososphaeraceae archaeon]
MGRKDWDYIGIPKLLSRRLENFLNTSHAKKSGIYKKSEILRNAIIQYLDEQEKQLNNMESINDFIVEMKEGDHILVTYNNNKQLSEIISSSMQRSLDKNQLFVLFLSKQEEEFCLQAMEKIRGDIASLLNNQEIIISHTEDHYIGENYSIQSFFSRFDEIKQIAIKKSKSGLNIIATLEDNLFRQQKHDEAIKIESQCHKSRYTSDIPITLMCLYKSIPEKFENISLENHDLIIKHIVTKTGIS